MNENNYDNDISINPDALDVEWTKQAQVFFKYAELAAKARDAVNRLKEKRDIVTANIGLLARKEPEKYGIDKITEATVQATIVTHPNYTEISRLLTDSEYELDILQSAVRALDQKKSALENLVRLQGQNYFAGPEAPRNLGAEWVKETERASARNKVKNKMGIEPAPTSKRSIAR